MHISKRALRKHFDPREYPKETYLLCKLEWRGGIRSWKHWVRNDDVNDCHAEQYFLEEIFEPRCYNICDMTWYLSYSPCWKCCDVIRDFLEEQTNVNIYIHVARLYYVNHPNNCRALRELNSLENVTIEAMEAEGKVSHAFWEGMNKSWGQSCLPLWKIKLLLVLFFRWKMQPEDFQRNYSPRQNGRVYLLYEIRWRSSSIWRNWCSNNPEQHAEVNFLENHFNNQPQTPCCITWFLSASPCGNCCRRILKFLRSHPNVTLVICAAKLFRHLDIRNRRGLRSLMMNGVAIHYRYCWRNFVAHQPGQDDYWPQNVTLYFILNSIELLHIFLVSRHLKKTPGAKINAKKKNPRKRRFG
uniref:C->U-editing enzyme APOBEC-1 n=1 Tax=Zonotrichia albicollis TaxID=44394 RepID=A0A8D2ND52_ZONAL